jgi:hypothetical protein
MYHRLFIAAEVIGKIWVLVQRLADSGEIAVTKNTETSREKWLFSPVAGHMLHLEESDNCLGSGESLRHFLC